MKKSRCHAVLVPCPLQGQITPMLHFAKLLIIEHGYTITFVSNLHMYPYVHKQANSINKNTNLNDHHQHLIRVVCLDDGLPPDVDYKNVTSQPVVFRNAVLHMMKDSLKHLLAFLLHPHPSPASVEHSIIIPSNVESFHEQHKSHGNYSQLPPAPSPTCVVVGPLCRSAYDTAASLGLPVFMLSTQCAAVLSIYHHLPLLIQNGFFPGSNSQQSESVDASENAASVIKDDRINDEVITYIPGLPHIHRSSFPSFFTRLFNPSLPAERQFEILLYEFGNLKDYKGILINTYTEIEGKTCQALQEDLHPTPVLPIGPLLPSEFWEPAMAKLNISDTGSIYDINNVNNKSNQHDDSSDEDRSILAWLDKKAPKSVLYISFGTIFTPAREDMASLVEGIKASKQPFLWVIRSSNSASAMDADLRKQLDELLNQVDGLIVPWAPQFGVLAHPAVGGFLTHSGWNSTLESLSMGVPMITLPAFLDQPTNSALIVDVLRTGLKLAHQENDLHISIPKSDLDSTQQQNTESASKRVSMASSEEDDEEIKARMHARFTSLMKGQQLIRSSEDVLMCIKELFHDQESREALSRRAGLLSQAAVYSFHGFHGDSRSNLRRLIELVEEK